MNQVVFVAAYFEPVIQEQIVKVPTGEKKKGLLGESNVMREEKKMVQTGVSDKKIDTIRLTNDLHQVVEGLNKSGFEVVSVTAVASGKHGYENYSRHPNTADTAVSWGYSYTDGLMVVARKV